MAGYNAAAFHRSSDDLALLGSAFASAWLASRLALRTRAARFSRGIIVTDTQLLKAYWTVRPTCANAYDGWARCRWRGSALHSAAGWSTPALLRCSP